MRLLTIGNIIRRKRFDLCALACKSLVGESPATPASPLIWRVIGRGPLADEIKRMAPPEMEFIDRVESLREHYQWADLFVLPSRDEGFGMVYIEAIMCGCPIVCTLGEGGTEIVETTGGGIAIEVPDSDSRAVENIVGAVNEVMSNHDRYMNRSIMEKARKMTDPERIAAEWKELIARFEKPESDQSS